MRYFFTLIGVMIVWRSFSWLRKDRNLKHRRLKQLPDAGTIGILTVETGSRQLQEGAIIPVPYEGVLGYLRTCDVVVPVDDVATIHLDFSFVDGKGLFIYPRRGCDAAVDGVALTSRRLSQQYPMQHGSILQIGQAVLRLGVFAGLNVREAHVTLHYPEEEFQGSEAWLPDLPEIPLPDVPYSQPISPDTYGQHSAPAQPLNPPYGTYWQGGDDDAQ